MRLASNGDKLRRGKIMPCTSNAKEELEKGTGINSGSSSLTCSEVSTFDASSASESEPELVEDDQDEKKLTHNRAKESKSSSVSREAALESRIAQLEGSLQQVIQILQQQHHQQPNIGELPGVSMPTNNNVNSNVTRNNIDDRPAVEYRAYSPTYEEGLRREIQSRSRSNSIQIDDMTDKDHVQPLSSAVTTHDNHTNVSATNIKLSSIMHIIPSSNNNSATTSCKEEKMTPILSTISSSKIIAGKATTPGKPPRHPFKKITPSPSVEDLTKLLAKSVGPSPKITSSSPLLPPTQSKISSNTDSYHHHRQTSFTLLNYVKTEMLGEGGNELSPQQKVVSSHATNSLHATDENMEEFRRIPYNYEVMIVFGLAICFDSYLYIFTFLPLKFVSSIVRLCATAVYPKTKMFQFHRRHMYQIYQVSIIYLVYTLILSPVPIGMLYHWIRGQAMIKLYVVIAMVEVFDRLLCAFGQDAMDSMYWNTMVRPKTAKLMVSWCVVLVYAALHSLVLFVHVAALNVAMNSADQALLSLLVGGNFAEIKSTVFKKYNTVILFNIAMSDVVERFKLAMFLMIILLLNISQGGVTMDMAKNYGSMCAIVCAAEVFADWIKHSFITKLNFIKSKAYSEYSLVLARDVTGMGHEGVNLDHTHAVVKRMGLAQIPLVCVMTRYLREAVRYAWMRSEKGGMLERGFCYGFRMLGGTQECEDGSGSSSSSYLGDNGGWDVRQRAVVGGAVLLGYLVLLSVKVVFGFTLQMVARRKMLDENLSKKKEGENSSGVGGGGGKDVGKGSSGDGATNAKNSVSGEQSKPKRQII